MIELWIHREDSQAMFIVYENKAYYSIQHDFFERLTMSFAYNRKYYVINQLNKMMSLVYEKEIKELRSSC